MKTITLKLTPDNNRNIEECLEGSEYSELSAQLHHNNLSPKDVGITFCDSTSVGGGFTCDVLDVEGFRKYLVEIVKHKDSLLYSILSKLDVAVHNDEPKDKAIFVVEGKIPDNMLHTLSEKIDVMCREDFGLESYLDDVIDDNDEDNNVCEHNNTITNECSDCNEQELIDFDGHCPECDCDDLDNVSGANEEQELECSKGHKFTIQCKGWVII